MASGGLSPAQLARMHDILSGYVERGEIPGLVALVSRRGETHIDAIGAQSIGRPPMQRDTIFRISSMTKPITAAAAMILVEECRIRLDEPINEWIPELANRRVLKSMASELGDTVPANRSITLFDIVHMEDELKEVFGREIDSSERRAVEKSENYIRRRSILKSARARKILRYTDHVSQEDLARDELIQDAVMRQVQMIGEAASRISSEMRERHPEVSWHEMIGNPEGS